MYLSIKCNRNVLVKIALNCFFLIASYVLVGQSTTSLPSWRKGELQYQVVNDECSDFSFWAKVRHTVNENTNYDLIETGINDSLGNTIKNPKQYPGRAESHFKKVKGIKLSQIKNPDSGRCHGYLLTFSGLRLSGNKLYAVRMDQSGNVMCHTALFDIDQSAYAIYDDVLYAEDGSIIIAGAMDILGHRTQLLVGLDVNCHVEIYHNN